jgi:hypothetical protein
MAGADSGVFGDGDGAGPDVDDNAANKLCVGLAAALRVGCFRGGIRRTGNEDAVDWMPGLGLRSDSCQLWHAACDLRHA